MAVGMSRRREPRSVHVGDESRAAAVAQAWPDSPLISHGAQQLGPPVSDRGVRNMGERKNTRYPSRLGEGDQGDEPMPDAG